MSFIPPRAVTAVLVLLAGLTAACSRPARVPAGSAPSPQTPRNVPAPPPDPVQVYRRLGLIAHGGALPMTGRVAFLAGATADTTLAVLTLALPSRGLSFTHTGADYRATYRVDADVRADVAPSATTPSATTPVATTPVPPASVATIAAAESVVVATFRETLREDESVLFQQVLRLAPGRYRLLLRVRDGGSARTVADTSALVVPRLAAGALATPMPYYELVVRHTRDATPRILATPRATVTFGRDSLLPLYLEAYGAGASAPTATPVPVHVAVRTEDGRTTWHDTVALAAIDGFAAGVVQVPVTYLGIGPATVEVMHASADGARAGGAGTTDTARAPVFVSFGDELPAATFEDMLNYLRYFTSPMRVEGLRRAAPGERAAAWSAFLLATDPDPAAPGHQGLQQYFARIQVANQRYREEGGPGWLTDRGMTFAAFGDPEQVFEPNATSLGQRNRVQVWIYRDRRLQLEFRDRTGFDRWELTPQARAEFVSALNRLHQ